ncbi:DUF4097 family beta strand repeat-containing protein [Streptomyces malaysiense]|uniref:DUF4097 domain-containing protein n=1 Tax=Streptomyces malaysiense TaxID=1428626 RepID=A0A1J4Q5N2_9ACTN|nr:DUF4097 family beta strand repeat-containing protein [Streptomyces malaysiense]OIK28461.1 hypothetical protein VT52_007415 [Streptomyces malaysiense]
MQKFDTPAPITAVLTVPAGRVQFIAADRADTTVEVLPAQVSKARDVKAAERTTVEYTGGVLRIDTPAGNQHLGPTGAIEVTVKLPAGSRVDARSAGAELRTVGRLGDVTFDGAYRRIKLDETASLHLTAIDGDIEVGRLGGPAKIDTTRGDIQITEATHGTVVLRTQSGDITVGAAPGTSAALDAGTAHGRIDNTLRNDGTPRLDIRATTSHGDITAHSL